MELCAFTLPPFPLLLLHTASYALTLIVSPCPTPPCTSPHFSVHSACLHQFIIPCISQWLSQVTVNKIAAPPKWGMLVVDYCSCEGKYSIRRNRFLLLSLIMPSLFKSDLMHCVDSSWFLFFILKNLLHIGTYRISTFAHCCKGWWALTDTWTQ